LQEKELFNTTKTQVIIIGAGPTGLSLAAQLIRYNIDFVILEKNSSPTIYSKAIAVQARTLEIFQEIGLAGKATKAGRSTTGLRLFYRGKTRAKLDLNNLGEGISAFRFALSLEQSKTEKLLVDHFVENGKNVLWNSELLRFDQNENGVTVYYKNSKGEEIKIEGDYLVGCDGAGSLVRHQLGLNFEGTTQPKLFYVADVIIESPVINNDLLYMFMIKKGFVLFFPMDGTGHYRIVGVMPDAKDLDQKLEFADVEPAMKKQLRIPIEIKELKWFSTYKVHSRKANAFMKGRCFIAGDAAHIHTPAGGQGMNTGIQDGYNLAWKIAYRLRGEVNDKVLDTYDTERSENAKRLLKTTDRIFDIMSGVNRFWDFIRLTFFPGLLKAIVRVQIVRKRIFPLLSQTGIAYPNSYLTIKSSVGKVKAGDRMHYFVFADGKQIFDYLVEPSFKLLFFGDKPPANDVAITDSNIKLIRYNFTEIPSSVFGTEKNFYVFLRPDNHVSYIGNSLEKCRRLIDMITYK